MCVYLYVNHHNIFYNSFNQNKAKNFKIYLSYTNKTCSLCCSPLFVTIVCSPLLLGGGRVEICMSPGLAQGPSPAQSIGRAGPSRQKSGDFYNGPGRQKRNEFFNYRAIGYKKKRKTNNTACHSGDRQKKDEVFKLAEKRLIMK